MHMHTHTHTHTHTHMPPPVADARYGGHFLLQCPNASAVAKFKRAVRLGDIVWHAAATDQEAVGGSRRGASIGGTKVVVYI